MFGETLRNSAIQLHFSAHCEVMSQRKRRSQQRLEAFIEKKKVQKLQDSFCKVKDARTPAGNDGSGVKTPARCSIFLLLASMVTVHFTDFSMQFLCDLLTCKKKFGVVTKV